MYDCNCPDCKDAKLQSDKNARKINEVIDQVNALIQVNNETVDFIEEKADRIVEEIAEVKVNEVVEDLITKVNNIQSSLDNIENRVETLESNSGGSGSDLNLRDVGDGEIFTIDGVDNDTPPSNISVTGVTLDKTSHSFKVGETVQLTPTILPSNATNKNVNWAASNENCTVTGGLVTAVKEGECVITCQTVDGSYKATCSITVQANSNANIVSDYYKQWNNITAATTEGNDDDIIRDNKDFTIFAKIENPTDESNPTFGIINNWNVSGNQSYQFGKNWQGKIAFKAVGVSDTILLQTTETFTDKGVSFISCVRSGQSLTIYVNNVEITSMTIASTFVFKDTQDVIKIGQPSKTLHTLLYYNRALTQEELTKNYNALGGV